MRRGVVLGDVHARPPPGSLLLGPLILRDRGTLHRHLVMGVQLRGLHYAASPAAAILRV